MSNSSYDWQRIVNELTDSLALVTEPLRQAGYQERVEDIADYIYAGEYILAIEHLTDALHELRLSVPVQCYHLLQKAGSAIHMDATIWERIASQVAES